MKKNLLKFFALACAMLVNATAGAQTLSIESFEIQPGETKPVTLDLVQDGKSVLAFQCDVVLPEGLTIQGRPRAVAGTLTDEFGDPAAPNVSFANGKVVVSNNDGLVFNSDAKAIVLINLVAGEGFSGGQISLQNIVMSLAGNVKIKPENVTIEVTGPAPVITGPSLKMDAFEITDKDTQTKVVPLKLIHNEEFRVLAFQCDFELPVGLTIQGKPRPVAGTLTDEFGEPANPNVSFANGKIVVSNNDGLAFNLDATDIVNITFKADNTFESGIIKIKNIVVSQVGNVKVKPADFEVKVNVGDGISIINANATGSSDIYTISGTRVRTMNRGLYIVNGKKVVVK